MTDGHKNCDWPEYKISVLGAIESTDRAINQIAKNVSDILQETAVIRSSLDSHLRSTKPLSRSEIKLMIKEAQKEKNGNGQKELSEAELEVIVKKVMAARLVAVADLRQWKFILLVIMIVVSYFVPGLNLDLSRFMEFLK